MAGNDRHDYLTDNPVRRHALKGSPGVEAAKAAQKEAGFEQGRIAGGSFGGFFYGFIDDYLFLMVFRPSDDVTFNPWMSPVGGGAIRNPAWDFGASVRRPLSAGEKVTFHVRLVYKPFAGLDDLLREVDAFQKTPAEE